MAATRSIPATPIVLICTQIALGARAAISHRLPIDEGRPRPRPESGEPGLLWRLILVAIGFGMALTGWFLILTVFLSFLGLPLFIFGLALMQSQER